MTEYVLEGESVGTCGCSISLECVCTGSESKPIRCGSFIAYHVLQGQIAHVNVAGLSLVRIVGDASVLYVDAQGSERQRDLLIQVFTGQMGGFLAEIQQLFPPLSETPKIAPISYVRQRGRANLWIGQFLVRRGMSCTPFQFSG
ncbi:DUF1326 domain-containing protein [Leptolyngbya sp. AN03gr2]|uniref:DUF1326 domain-containing protein n=1 Tax=unclassified Leptolyngbya TaxID=2650499 RepID=UPI003D31AB59